MEMCNLLPVVMTRIVSQQQLMKSEWSMSEDTLDKGASATLKV